MQPPGGTGEFAASPANTRSCYTKSPVRNMAGIINCLAGNSPKLAHLHELPPLPSSQAETGQGVVLGLGTRPRPIPSQPGRMHITLCSHKSRSCFYIIYLLCIFIVLIPGRQADTPAERALRRLFPNSDHLPPGRFSPPPAHGVGRLRAASVPCTAHKAPPDCFLEHNF